MASGQKTDLNVLITGAGGFIGQALTSSLLSDPLVSHITMTDVIEPTIPRQKIQSKVYVKTVEADLTSAEICKSILTPGITLVYLLHGIMSGAAEANLEQGLAVNIDSTRQILDILRTVNPGVKIIYPSSLAVYGPPERKDLYITELNAPLPGSSYGAQKLICETLLNDFSRRGLLDGRILRLPTVTVRPGKPTGATSSFASGIFREPLNGERSILPTSKDLEMWICSPRTVVRNLIHARDIPKEKFEGKSRTVNLPGMTVSINEMLDALKEIGGEEVLKLIEEKQDENIQRIVSSWPARLDTSWAKSLGFADDGPFTQILQDYIEDYGRRESER